MDGGDKALITIGGTAILDWVIARLQPATTAIILNANGDPARFARWHLPVVADAGADSFDRPAGPMR
jgi:molybdenum cofactor guanylyltransferase